MTPTSLTFLFEHPAALGVTCLRPAGLGLLLALPLFFLRPHRADARVAALRTAAFLFLTMVLADVRLTTHLPDDRLSIVATVDVSDSIGAAGEAWARRYLDQVARGLAPGDELAAVTFANETRVARPPSPPAPFAELAAPAARTATNIEQAINTAATLLPEGGERRVLLISDGNETRGDGRRALARLGSSGVRVDVAVPPTDPRPDLRVDKLVAGPVVPEGAVFPLRVIAHNQGTSRAAVLKILVDGLFVHSTDVTVAPGLNSFEIPYQLTEPGSHRLRVVLESAGDPTPRNNALDASITVTGKTRVLLVGPHDRSRLAALLATRAIDVERRPPGQFPANPEGLLDFHAVVFEDITADGLSATRLDALERYVSEFGGGFILAGGTHTFGDPRFKQTALDHLLPVTLEPRRPSRRVRDPLALFILIDRSGSMGYNSRIRTLRDGEKLRYAKQAALAVVSGLRDDDLVGLIVFDSEAHPIAPLRSVRENRRTIEEDIPRLKEYGGTDFYDALAQARAQLAVAPVNRRHLILLTDGDTNRPAAEHYPLVGELAAAKISVTTIRIGNDDVNLRLLQDISARTGGQFHHARNAETLPELMLRDATQAIGPPQATESFFLQQGTHSEALRGIPPDTLPPVNGYAYARLKTGADLPLFVSKADQRDPLLAVWQFGLGRVAAFTASPADDAEQWPAWPEFSRFWSQLVHWTASKATPGDYAFDVQWHDGVAELTVRSFDPSADDRVVSARIIAAPEDPRELHLVPRAPQVFTARLPTLAPGRYPVSIVRRRGRQPFSQRTALVTIPADDETAQDEYRSHGPNLALLTHLADATGGSLNLAPRDLATRHPGSRLASYALDGILVPLVMLLFLGDIALRRWSADPQ